MNRITTDNYEAFLLDYMEGQLDEARVEELKAFAMNHPELEIDLNDLELPVLSEEPMSFDLKGSLKKTDPAENAELLFDYLENNLPVAEREALEAKLLTDKTLSIEFHLLKKTVLSVDAVEVFQNKSTLYKTENDLLLKDQVLSYFEGQFTGTEKIAFEARLKTEPNLQKELGLYSKTKLSADAAIIYPDKEELKKEARVIALFSIRNVAAIAAALLLLVGLFVVFNSLNNDQPHTQPALANIEKQPAHGPSHDSSHSVSSPSKITTGTPSSVALAASVKPTLEVKSPVKNPEDKVQQQEELIPHEESNVAVETPKKEETPRQEQLLAQEAGSVTPSHTLPENNSVAHETFEKHTILAIAEDPEESGRTPRKKGLWNRATRLAKRANNIGIKAVDGDDGSRERFSLFNASVEKH